VSVLDVHLLKNIKHLFLNLFYSYLMSSEKEDRYIRRLTNRFRRITTLTIFGFGTYFSYKAILSYKPDLLR